MIETAPETRFVAKFTCGQALRLGPNKKQVGRVVFMFLKRKF